MQIVIESNESLIKTLDSFTQICNSISKTAWNFGKPLKALDLHRRVYGDVKGTVSSQLTCTSIRLTAGAYAAARKNGHDQDRPFNWHRPFALFLVGKRGRDANFMRGGLLSISTIDGRKHLKYTIPEAFREDFYNATEIDSIIVKNLGDKLIGYVANTVELPDVKGVHPLGIDLNETNAIVAVDADGNELFISGLDRKIKNKRTSKTIKRLQRKLAQKKAEGKNTRSVVRALKRLRVKRSRRTKDFCNYASKRLVEWAPENCVLVFEDLDFEQGKHGSKAWGRRFSIWPRGMIYSMVSYKVQGKGVVAKVNPRNTSKACSRCGLPGTRKRHSFTCPHCGFSIHADLNAA
ncbi:MAG TPA: transposase, partial [Methanotrichaceae archaeon]|nr:transposase [Methanotrichaceae archaeon]